MNFANAMPILAALSWMIVIGAIVFRVVAAVRGGRAGALVPLVVGALLLALVLFINASVVYAIEPTPLVFPN